MKLHLFTAALLVAAPAVAFAQVPAPMRATATMRHHRVVADGRCDGISYGTGARRCGTRTGGPVGGLSGRN